jgi:hypothetical protein
MSNGKKLIIGLIMIGLCANFGQQESDTTKEKPRVNFRGLLRDNSGQEFSVENITIGGLYKDIPVYAKPITPTSEPEINTTLLDLSEVDEIKPTFEHPEQKLVDYQNRRYVEITVILKDAKKTTMNFIIELSRKIMCDIKTEAGDVEKRLSFEALQSLKLQDYIKNEESKRNKTQEKTRDKNREYQCREAGKALKKLEDVSEKVSGEQKSKLTELIESLKNWIGGICGTQA